MSIIGIVCEFNPFHCGHKHLIDSVKKDGDTLVCVMSGSFVQRGEPAIFPKDIRVEAALKNGADIVLELPFIYATASAEFFCENAVRILDGFGCDTLAFGSECGDIGTLKKAAEIIANPDFDEKIKQYIEKGVSYPTARETAVRDFSDGTCISLPNDILAVEYIKAINKNGYKIKPVTVKREGAGYNSLDDNESFASATLLRKMICEKDDISRFIPENTWEIYRPAADDGRVIDKNKYELAALSLLRSKKDCIDEKTAYMSEGLENRIKAAISTETTLDGIFDAAKTKRYTHSRIRRAVLASAFGITKDIISIKAPYVRLLGFNTNASEALGKCVKKAKLPFIASYSDVAALKDEIADCVFKKECEATDIFSLSLSKSEPCGAEMRYMPQKIK